MYVEMGSILPGDESEAEKNQTKEDWTCSKDLPTYLMTGEKVQWEEVAPRNLGKWKGPPENREQWEQQGGQTSRQPPAATPTAPKA